MKKLLLILASGFLLGCPGIDNGGGGSTPYGTDFANLDPVAPNARSLGSAEADWYKDAVFYHLWIPAFNNGDSGVGVTGEGDVQGILDQLDYLQNDLGVTAIWLSPFWESGSNYQNRHNYDAEDHYTLNSAFGATSKLTELISELHTRGMKIILDWVPNHVGSGHQWFVDSTNSANGKRDWFVWRDSQPSGWTGWDSVSDFHGPTGGAYYYGIFWSGMPDLNYANQEVRDATGNVQMYWLNQGFDGLRVDAVRYLYEDWDSDGSSGKEGQPATFEHFVKIRQRILDPFSSESGTGGNLHKFMVAENWTTDRDDLMAYMEHNGQDAFHMTLDFPFAYATASLNMTDLNSHWNWVKATVEPAGGWMGTFTSNHDNVVSRPVTNFAYDYGKVRAQAALQMTGVGTPFIYYGNELGMTGASGNDINLRQRIDWANVTTQIGQADSLLNWHKALITLRKNRVSLRRGSYTLVQNSGGIFAFERAHLGERTLVVVNLSGSTTSPTVTLSTAPGGRVTLFGTNNVGGSGNDVTLNNMTGYAVRVIKLEDGGAVTNLWPTDMAYAGETPPDMYVRGDFLPTNWNPGQIMAYSSGVFSVTLNIPTTGAKSFKFFNGTWYGRTNSSYDSSIGGDAGLTFSGADNITFNVTTAGNHTFYFRLSDAKYSLDAP